MSLISTASLISTPYAQAASGPTAGGVDMLMQIAPLVLIFVVFYFLLIRPQQKRAKDHKATLESVRRGDVVVTGGGIIGKIVKVQDNEATVEIADGVRIKVLKTTITEVRTKGQPLPAEAAEPKSK